MYKMFLSVLDYEISKEIGGGYATIAQAEEAMLGYTASKIREILEAHKSDAYLNDAFEEINEETCIRILETDEKGEINYDGDGELLVYQDEDEWGTIYYYLYTDNGIVRKTYSINTGAFEDQK